MHSEVRLRDRFPSNNCFTEVYELLVQVPYAMSSTEETEHLKIIFLDFVTIIFSISVSVENWMENVRNRTDLFKKCHQF